MPRVPGPITFWVSLEGRVPVQVQFFGSDGSFWEAGDGTVGSVPIVGGSGVTVIASTDGTFVVRTLGAGSSFGPHSECFQ